MAPPIIDCDLSVEGNTIIAKPRSPLPANTKIKFTATTGIRSTENARLEKDFSASFQTAAAPVDEQLPEIVLNAQVGTITPVIVHTDVWEQLPEIVLNAQVGTIKAEVI